MKIWHHAHLETEEECEEMVFLSASSTPEYRGKSPVYVFREITMAKVSFRPKEELPAGEIRLRHFCLLSIARKLGKRLKKKCKTIFYGLILSFSYVYYPADWYSARLYKSKSKKMVIFSMCLLQPHDVEVSSPPSPPSSPPTTTTPTCIRVFRGGRGSSHWHDVGHGALEVTARGGGGGGGRRRGRR